MGTSCKKCPFKDIKKEEGSCIQMFAKKYHNSCVTYDIAEEIMKATERKVNKLQTEIKSTQESQIKPSEPLIRKVTIPTPPKVNKTPRKPNNGQKRETKKKVVTVEEKS